MSKDLVNGFFCGALIGFVFGALASNKINDDYYQKKAIEHGAAHYDKVTGKWEWNK